MIRTEFGTGDGTTPGGTYNPSGNILATALNSVSRTGTFYREDSGYTVTLSRLYDGDLGPAGSSGLGSDGDYTVMPNLASIVFYLDGAYDITKIRTYASWDSGRSGQGYAVFYATAAAPESFYELCDVPNFNNDDSIFDQDSYYDYELDQWFYYPISDQSSTMVQLTSDSGLLAPGVVALKFVFDGYQNGGTAFREFHVDGNASAVPEPTGAFVTSCLLIGGLFLRTRRARVAVTR